MDICNYFDKQDSVAFVAVSLGNHNYEVAYELATRIKLPIIKYYDKVHIVTFDDTEINEKIFKDGHNNEIFTYNYNCVDMDPVFKVRKSVVIFDNLSNALEFLTPRSGNALEIMDKIAEHNFVIVLGNMKTSKEELKKFSDFFIEAKFWNDSFMTDKPYSLGLKLHRSVMTPYQYQRQHSMMKHYIDNKKKKIHQNLWKEDGFENAKRFCNIVYDETIQSNIEDAVKSQSQEDFYYENSPKKLMNRCGGAYGLMDSSPKFSNLYEVIKSNSDRHIIYTSFDSYYGSDMIYTMLVEMNIPTIYIGNEHTTAEKMKALNVWNNSHKHRVLIVGSILPEAPKNVNHIHILDSNLKDVFDKVYDTCKYENCGTKTLGSSSSISSVSIHLHMSERPSLDLEKTIDELTFPEFYEYLNIKKNFWELVLENSKKINMNHEGRLIV